MFTKRDLPRNCRCHRASENEGGNETLRERFPRPAPAGVSREPLVLLQRLPGAPRGPEIMSIRTVFGNPLPLPSREPYNVDEGESCRSMDHAGPTFSHYETTGCQVPVRAGETYRWKNCSAHSRTNNCYSVSNRISDPVCSRKALPGQDQPGGLQSPVR